MPLARRPSFTINQAVQTGSGSLGGTNIPSSRQMINTALTSLSSRLPIAPTPPLESSTAGLLYQQNQQMVQGYQGAYPTFNPQDTGGFRTSNTSNPTAFDPNTAPPLPYGAIEYDKYGNPYFGPGFEGWWKKFMWSVNGQKTTKDQQLTFGDRFEGVWDAAWGSLFDLLNEPAIKTGQTMSLMEEQERMGEEVNHPFSDIIAGFYERATSFGMPIGVSKVANIYGTDYRQRDVEMANKIGDALGIYKLGRLADWGHNVLDAAARMEDYLKPNAIYMALAPQNPDFVKNFTGVKKGDVLEGELPFLNPEGRLNAAWNAGRILYTSVIDPMVRYEYMREYMNGDGLDKFNLYQKYENPYAEMVGQLVFDPLNVIPFNLLKAGDQMAGARRMFSNLAPGLENVFKRAIDDVPLQERAWSSLDNAIKAQLVDNVKLARGAADAELDNWAKAKGLFGPGVDGNARRGVFPTFNLTTTAKRTVIHKTIGELTSAIVSSVGKDPDKFADVMKGLYLMGSNNEAEIAEGLSILMDFSSPRMLMSRGGQYLSAALRNMVDGDIDKFVKTGQKIFQDEGLEAYLKFIDNKYNDAVSKLIPSSDDKVAAMLINRKLAKGALKEGDEFMHAGRKYAIDKDVVEWARDVGNLGNINSAERAVLAVHNATRPFYGAINNFFSTVYMGLSPRYAIRNMINNYFTGGVDEGVGAIFGSSQDAIAGLERILGWVPEGATRSITSAGQFAAGEGAKSSDKWYRWGQKLAEKFESDSASKITYAAVSRAMRQMVRPGKALPDFAPLLQAGFDPALVNRITNMIIENGYDVKPVVKEIVEAMATGRRTRGALEWMPAHLIKPLDDIGLYPKLVDVVKGAATKDEAIKRAQKVFDDFMKFGDKADEAYPAIHVGEEVASDGGWMSVAQELDRTFGEASDLAKNAKNYRDANVATEWQLRSLVNAMYQRLLLKPNPETEPIRIALQDIMMGMEKNPVTRVHNIIREAVLDFKSQIGKMDETQAKKAYEAIFNMDFPEELKNNPATRDIIEGLRNMLPGIGAEFTGKKGSLGKVWEHFFFPRMRFVWGEYLDTLYNAVLDPTNGIVKRLNEIDPQIAQDLYVKVPTIDDSYRTAKAWGQWSESVEWVQMFSATTPEGRLAMLANTYGIPTAKQTGESGNYMLKRVLRLVNDNMPEQYKIRFPKGFRTVTEATENPQIVNEALRRWQLTQPINVNKDYVSLTGQQEVALRNGWRDLVKKIRQDQAEIFQIETYFKNVPEKQKRLAELQKRVADNEARIDQIRMVVDGQAVPDGKGGWKQRPYVPGQRITIPKSGAYQPGKYANPGLGMADQQVRSGNIRFLPPKVREDILNVAADIRARVANFMYSPMGSGRELTQEEVLEAMERSVGGVDTKVAGAEVKHNADWSDLDRMNVYDPGTGDVPAPASGKSNYEPWYRDLPAAHYIDARGDKITNKRAAVNQVLQDLADYGTIRKDTAFARAVMEQVWREALRRAPNAGLEYADTTDVATIINYIDDALNEADLFRFTEALKMEENAGANEKILASLKKRIEELETRVPLRGGEIPGQMLDENLAPVGPEFKYGGWARAVADELDLEATVKAAQGSINDLIDNLAMRGEELPQELQAKLASLDNRAKRLVKRYSRGGSNVVSEAVPEAFLMDNVYRHGPFEYALKFDDDIDTGLWLLSNPKIGREQRLKVLQYLEDMTGASPTEIKEMSDNFYKATLSYLKKQIPLRPKSVYAAGLPPSATRIAKESQKTVKAMMERVIRGIDTNFGTEDVIVGNAAMRDALEKWASIADKNITQSKLIAAQVGDIARDFALHDYRLKNSMDLVLAYVYPYSYWYTRTYNNWMKRLAYNPNVMAGYAKYKDAMAKVHAGMPEWWKYNVNVNELLGIESDNPLYFNLESTLWPLYALTGVNFDDPKKRYNAVATVMDTIDNFGPSPWTMYGIALALHASSKGDDEAAQRLAGRLFPQTKDLRNMFALAGLGNVDIDPFIQLFANGVDPYDQRLAVRALSWMLDEGKYTREQLIDAGRSRSGPIWDEAVNRAVEYRAGGGRKGLAGLGLFMMSQLGVGFRPRTQEDMLIDMYDRDIGNLFDTKDNLSPMEYGNSQDMIRAQYPFADIMTISRGTANQRDEYYSYNVLSRIPPGQRDDVMKLFGMDYDMVQQFYDSKGDILTREWIDSDGNVRKPWSEADRSRFMASVLDIGTVLRLPDDATRQKWRAATTGYANMRDAMMKAFGPDIHMKVAAYYDFKNAGQGDAFLQLHPEVGDAFDFRTAWMMTDQDMAPYYSSIQAIEIYYNNLRKEAIEKDAVKKYGITPDQAWAQYDEASLSGTASEYWKSHPIMDWLMDVGDYYDKELAKRLVSVENALKMPEFPELRQDIPEGVSGGAEALMQYSAAGQQTYYDLPMEAFTSQMSPTLQALVNDYLYDGMELPSQANKQLDYIAQRMGIYNTQLMLEIMKSKQ